MKAFIERAEFWAIAAITFAAFAVIAGFYGIVLLFAIASLHTLREFLTLTHTRRGDHWALLAAFFVVLPFQYILIATGWYGLSSIMIPVYAFLGLPIIAAVRGDTQNYMERVAEVQWGLMTCVYCLSYVPALQMLEIQGYPGNGLNLILFFAIVVIGTETIGGAFQSQKTTHVAGFATVAALGAALAAATSWLTAFPVLGAAGLGAVIGMLGLAGSEVMAAVRHDRGIEIDTRLLPESERIHGFGLIGRLERMMFAAPVFFHLVRFWWTA